jgi:hypothetical protein
MEEETVVADEEDEERIIQERADKYAETLGKTELADKFKVLLKEDNNHFE